MSDQDTYDKFCSVRFSAIEKDAKDTNSIVHEINAIVTNGLQERMIKVEKTCNGLMKTLITLLLLIIASTITLYATSNKKMNEVLIKIERMNDDPTN